MLAKFAAALKREPALLGGLLMVFVGSLLPIAHLKTCVFECGEGLVWVFGSVETVAVGLLFIWPLFLTAIWFLLQGSESRRTSSFVLSLLPVLLLSYFGFAVSTITKSFVPREGLFLMLAGLILYYGALIVGAFRKRRTVVE